MICAICKRTEDDLKKLNAEEIANIETVLSIIQDKIKKTMEASATIPAIQPKSEINNENCSGETGEHCKKCNQSHSIDEANYYWCEKYKLSVDISQGENKNTKNIVKRLNKEIDILKSERQRLENMELTAMEIDITNKGDHADYANILAKYSSDSNDSSKNNKNDWQKKKTSICPVCYNLFNKIIQDIVDEKIDFSEDDDT
jgi:Zn finger protein HypA/HybF involved in hydrogenase expression